MSDSLYEQSEKLSKEGDADGARQLLQQAAEAHHFRSMIRLFELDNDRKWIDRAIELGSSEAMNALALHIHVPAGQFAEAKALYEKAIDLGNTDAMYNLAHSLEHGEGEPANHELAKFWFDRGAELGDADCLERSATMVERGQACQKNEELAERMYETAFEKGSLQAAVSLGDLLQEYRRYEEADQWYRKAADKNFPLGWKKLAEVEEDEDKKIEYYRKAYDLGRLDTAACLAWLFQAKEDWSSAHHWWEKADEAGVSEARSSLGTMYIYGARDEEKGLQILLEGVHDLDEDCCLKLEVFLRGKQRFHDVIGLWCSMFERTRNKRYLEILAKTLYNDSTVVYEMWRDLAQKQRDLEHLEAQVKYQPGGFGYYEAMADFESKIPKL